LNGVAIVLNRSTPCALIALFGLAAVTLVAAAACSAVPSARVGATVGAVEPAAASRVETRFSVGTVMPAPPAHVVTRVNRVYEKQRSIVRPRKRPHGQEHDPLLAESLLDNAITNVPRAGDAVAITFDDGPSPYTLKVLAILKKYGVHATFFMIGDRARLNRPLVKDVLAQGSEIGNHTMTHVPLIGHSLAWDEAQIADADRIFFAETGIHPVYVRTRGGLLDLTGLRAIKYLKKQYVYWDVKAWDYLPGFSPAEIHDTVMAAVHPGSVILMHEYVPNTIIALPGIIRDLQARGLKVGSVTELLRRR
jgi:peptidoglycan/xylan/chitin deacetylase (PgdA/CDA1 family)